MNVGGFGVRSRCYQSSEGGSGAVMPHLRVISSPVRPVEPVGSGTGHTTTGLTACTTALIEVQLGHTDEVVGDLSPHLVTIGNHSLAMMRSALTHSWRARHSVGQRSRNLYCGNAASAL